LILGRASGDELPHFLKHLKVLPATTAIFASSPVRAQDSRPSNLRITAKWYRDGARLWAGGRNLAAEYFIGILKGEAPVARLSSICKTRRWPPARLSNRGRLGRGRRHARRASGQRTSRTPDREPTRTRRSYAGAAERSFSQRFRLRRKRDTVHALLIDACFQLARDCWSSRGRRPRYRNWKREPMAAHAPFRIDWFSSAYSNHRLADCARTGPCAPRQAGVQHSLRHT